VGTVLAFAGRLRAVTSGTTIRPPAVGEKT
jgi:hypothetical protein